MLSIVAFFTISPDGAFIMQAKFTQSDPVDTSSPFESLHDELPALLLCDRGSTHFQGSNYFRVAFLSHIATPCRPKASCFRTRLIPNGRYWLAQYVWLRTRNRRHYKPIHLLSLRTCFLATIHGVGRMPSHSSQTSHLTNSPLSQGRVTSALCSR